MGHSHREGDKHPAYAPNWSMVQFTFTLLVVTVRRTNKLSEMTQKKW